MTPSLYDLLDVDRTASDAEIRAAWKAAIADLDPSDRRFRAYNQAAEVLLDPARRAAYDAELAAAAPDEDPDDGDPGPEGAEPAAVEDDAPPVAGSTAPVPAPAPAPAPRSVPGPVLAVVAAATLALVVLTVVAWTRPHAAPQGVVRGLVEAVSSDAEASTREAQSAAERAIVPILSYDYRRLEEDRDAAEAQMTSDYRKEYASVFELLLENAPRTETVVSVEVVASAVVRSGDDRAEFLVFLNRPTTNAENREPIIYKDQVRVQVERVGEDWLVDCLITTPNGTCE